MKMENRVVAIMHPCSTPVSVSTMKGSDSERLKLLTSVQVQVASVKLNLIVFHFGGRVRRKTCWKQDTKEDMNVCSNIHRSGTIGTLIF